MPAGNNIFPLHLKKIKMKKITPCLWYDSQAEEAARFYVSVFPDSEILNISRYPEGTPDLAGKVLTVFFRLNGEDFIALNGGPLFQFTEAVSFSIDCKDQEEVDYYWNKLTEGGEESQCGWLKDRFGLSWQVVPTDLGKWIYNPNPAKAQKAMMEMLKMQKLDIAVLKRAVEE
jgi:predicted 3-demethylubiquinone-9 3-methyltransferase (glyoxalase superfamily)